MSSTETPLSTTTPSVLSTDRLSASGSPQTFTKSRDLQERAHRLIPGGCHTYAKGDDQFPELSPGFISRGEGSHVWDVDGNEYIEYGMGCRAVTLGHAFGPVVDAARRTMDLGSNFSRPARIEVECAEYFLGHIDRADMVKFCKDGSSATTAAIKLARAYTGRTHVAFCKDHPFFATNDWFIGTTPLDSGIPESVQELSVPFHFNDLASLEAAFEQHPDQIACVILESAKYSDPEDRFLHRAQEVCRKHGAVFILDEMITGFRWHNGGAQAYYDITPDLSTFGKALANGFSVSALAGKRHLMELGGLYHDKERVFLLSTTHGAETHSLAAAIETMRIYHQEPVIETIWDRGRLLKSGLDAVIKARGMEDSVQIIGKPCCLVFVCRDQNGDASQAFRTLFLQETIKRGLLMTSLVLSYSHTEEDILKTIDAIEGALGIYQQALNDGVENYLIGRPSKGVYRRFN